MCGWQNRGFAVYIHTDVSPPNSAQLLKRKKNCCARQNALFATVLHQFRYKWPFAPNLTAEPYDNAFTLHSSLYCLNRPTFSRLEQWRVSVESKPLFTHSSLLYFAYYQLDTAIVWRVKSVLQNSRFCWKCVPKYPYRDLPNTPLCLCHRSTMCLPILHAVLTDIPRSVLRFAQSQAEGQLNRVRWSTQKGVFPMIADSVRLHAWYWHSGFGFVITGVVKWFDFIPNSMS